MKEHVGKCSICGKDVYCLDGFFNGVHTDDNKIVCFECDSAIHRNDEES